MVGGVVSGDPDAFELFVRQYEGRIRQFVRNGGVPASDVPDVAQDILIEALRQISLGQFEHRSNVATWMRRVAHGRIVDYWRSRGRRGRDRTSSLETADLTTAHFSTPAAQEARLLVAQALATMPPRHRIAITAHCRAGVRVETLAQLFGLSVQRTRNIITEAKAMFRTKVCGGEKTMEPGRLESKNDDRD